MSSFGSGSTTTAGASITLRNFTGTDGNQAGTDGLVPGPGIAQEGYVLGAQGDWTLTVSAINDLNDATNRIATTAFVQNRVAQIVAGGGGIALGGIQDVDLAGLVDNQLLQYNAGDAEWQPLTLTISSISDVDLAGLQDGNALVYSAAANAGAGGWVAGEGGGGGATNLNDLGDVTINGGADKHFLVRNAQGQYVNRLISTADLSDEADLVLETRGATFGGNDYDFTGANSITVPAPNGVSDATTKAYVDAQVATKQPLDATLTALSGVVTVADKLIYATGADVFATTDFTNFGRTLIANANAGEARTDLGLGTSAVEDVGVFAQVANNLNDLADVGTARTNLGLGTSAVEPVGTFAQVANNLNDLANAGTARTNLGLGTSAVEDVGSFAQVANNLNDLADAGTARTNLGLGTASTQNVGTFVQVANNLNDLADVGTARTNLGLGTAAESAVGDFLASDADINDLGGISTADKAEGKILKFNAQNNLVVADDEGKTQEEIEDIVGGMVDGNTETGITVTYQGADNTLDFEVDNTLVGFLGGVQTFTGNKTFTGEVDLTGATATGETQGASDNSTSLATTAYVDAQIDTDIASLNLALTFQAIDASLDTITGIADGDLLLGNGLNSFEKISVNQGVENFLKSNGGIRDLSDTNFNLDYLVNANHFMVSNGLGSLVNQTISTANLSNSGAIVLETADATFGANTYDFTGATAITVPVPTNGSDATTKTYVDTKQPLDATLTELAGLATGAKKLIYSTADDTLEMIDLSDNAKTFIASDAELGDLDKVVIAGNIGVGNDGETLRWDGANLEWKNSKLSFGDLNQNVGSTQNVALLNAEQTFSNNITFTAEVDLTGATSTAETVANNNVEGNSTRVATTAFVKTVLAQVGGVSDLDDLTDVSLGVKNEGGVDEDGVALANAQILVYDGDGGNNDTTFKNVSLSGDITITNAGVVELADDSVTSTKIENSSVANAKLQTPYLDLTVGGNTDRLNLGETFTIEGTVGEVEVSGLADAQGANADATLTIGLPDDVTIANDLTVTRNLIVNGTTTTLNTATLDVEDTIIRLNKGVATGENTNDIGLFFERGTTGDDAIFYWDEGDDFFKLGLTTNDDHEDTDFGATTTPSGLQIGSLELRDDNATSLVIQEGGNAYLTFNTTDAEEKIVFGKVFEGVTSSKIGDVEISNGQIQTTAVNNNLSFVDNNLVTTGTANFGGTTVDSLDASSGGITLAGAISGISSLAGSDLDLNLTDNEATSFEVKGDVKAVGNNSYLTFVTTNNSEEVVFNQGGVDIDFRVEGETQTHLLYADATNDRVGINTDTPLAEFHVEGSTVLVGSLTQSGASATFNNGEGDFDFRVAGENQSNLFFVDASTDRVGVRTNTPSKILDVVGDVGISTTLDVTGKTTLVGSLDLTTDSTTGITFRSEIGLGGGDADQTLLSVNNGEANPKNIKWVSATDLFEIESGLKSTGNFTVGADLVTINATTGITSIKGSTTLNNVGGTSDLIIQNNGADVLNVDVSEGLTTITGIATVSSQLKTDDLRGLTVGTGNFKIRLEDNVANALEISDATNALSFMTFTTTDDSESITLSQDTIFKKAISIENTNTNGLFFNSNRSAEVSEDATLITIEGGSNKNDVVLAWDTSDNALNLNAQAQVHLQGLVGANALTLGGALVANATITMTTAGAITLDGTLDSPTINTDKITDKAGDGIVIEVSDNQASALFIQQGGGSGNGGEDYLTLSSADGVERITLHQNTTIASQLQVNASTTLGGVLNLKSDNVQPLIKANSDLTAENAESDATLIEVERGTLTNAKFKWDETSDSFEFDSLLSAEGNFQVGIDAQNPKATINSTSGNVSTDGTISATSAITTDSVLNFTTASQGAIVFNSDLGNGANPADADDFGLTINRGAEADAKLYWDEGDNVWRVETGNVQITESLVVDSDADGKITISSGQIVSESGTISFDDENLTTTGSITSATPALATSDTTVATTAFVKGQKLGDFDEVDTSGFDTTGQVLVWDQENSTFEVGTSIYNAELARDDVATALIAGNASNTGATSIVFSHDDDNDLINLALGITTEDLTDVSTTQATNNQVLRFTTDVGDDQNKYVPTTLGTASDVDTGLSNGNVPTLTTHHYSTKTNETADLVITGRIIESINYGLVNEAYDANTDWALDFGSVADTGISSWEDYGQLVV